jgi:small-conductance mechanosensitive channel
MVDYLKHLYEKVGSDIMARGMELLPLFAKVAVILLCALVAWTVLKRLLRIARRKVQKSAFVRINEEIFDLAQKALWYALVLLCAVYIIQLFEIPLLEKILYAMMIVLVAVPVKEFTLLVLKYLEAGLAKRTQSKIDDIVFELLDKFAGVIIYAIAILLALDVLGINVMPFVAGAGVAGIAVGFAAKDTLSNLIAGVLLIIDRPFEVGDRIEVWSAPMNSATWGDVIDIGLRATKIRTTDNIVIVIPNNEIMKRDIVNYTTISKDIRVRIPIGVSYDTDIQKAKSVIAEAATTAEWVLKDPPPRVVVKQFGASSVDLELRVWIEDARRRIDTISYMTDRVKESFDKAGIEIPYPKRDITIKQTG